MTAKEKTVNETIHAQGIEIGIYTTDFENEFISLTDIARYKSDDPAAVIQNWMRNRDVIEFLGLWETLHNSDFKPLEFEGFKNAAGANAFTMSPQKWIKATNAIGIVSKSGRYGGGTFAHSDIAMEFASWVSAEFKLYIVKDYRRLKSCRLNGAPAYNTYINIQAYEVIMKKYKSFFSLSEKKYKFKNEKEMKIHKIEFADNSSFKPEVPSTDRMLKKINKNRELSVSER